MTITNIVSYMYRCSLFSLGTTGLTKGKGRGYHKNTQRQPNRKLNGHHQLPLSTHLSKYLQAVLSHCWDLGSERKNDEGDLLTTLLGLRMCTPLQKCILGLSAHSMGTSMIYQSKTALEISFIIFFSKEYLIICFYK